MQKSTLPAEVACRLSDDEVLLTRREAAAMLRRSVPTLERWAARGDGPEIRRLGGAVYYQLAGLKRFVNGK